MDKALFLSVVVVLLLALAGCMRDHARQREPLIVRAAQTSAQLTPSDDGVDSFLVKNRAFTSGYEDDNCYNVTPDFVAEHSDYQIYKYESSTAAFLLYDGAAYALGEYFGGPGATSFALADLNADGRYELYFAFSWGSGLHRAQVGYFDPVNKTVTVFDYLIGGADLMLTAGGDGALCVSRADLEMKSFVEISAAAKETVGTVVWEEEEIRLGVADGA